MAGPTVGVLTTDRDLVVRSWDGWVADATGIPADAACGVPLVSLVPDLEERGLLRRLRDVAERGTVEVLAPAFHGFFIPCPVRRPSAYFSRMQQRVTLSPLRSGDELVGVVVEIEDVTERREEERRLAERLASGDEGERVGAAEALAALGAPAEVVVGAFADESWRVRKSAAVAASRDESGAAADLLVRVLRERHRDLGVLNATVAAIVSSGADVLPRLVELLASPDEDLRIYVALALGHLGDPRGVPPLLDALGDDSVNVRFHALEALGRLGARAAVDAVADVAETRDFFLASAAVDALAAIGDASVSPRLLPLLDDEVVGLAALDALGRLGAEDSVAPVTALLSSGDVPAAAVAQVLASVFTRLERTTGHGALVVEVVRSTVTTEGASRLVAALSDAPDGERPALVLVASWLDSPQVDDLLAGALEDPGSRLAAIDALVGRGPGAVPSLTRRLPGLGDEALQAAVVALGRIGSAAAVPALVRLPTAHPDVAVRTAGALGAIGDPAAFEPLLGLLASPHPAVRQAAIGALNSIGHPEMPARVEALLASPDTRLRESAARIAGYFGYPGAAEGVLALTRDPEEGVRRAAVEHLASFDDPRVPGRLMDVVRDDTPAVRAAAARALALLPRADAVALAQRALEDADLWVRYYAARSAAALRAPELEAPLRERALRDPVVPVRIAALEALAASADPATLPLFLDLAGSDVPEVALAALAALGRFADPRADDLLADALASGDPDRARVALRALGSEAPPATVEAVAEVARSTPDEEVAREAMEALVRVGSADAIGRLLALAAATSRRETCVELLARAGARVLPRLDEALRAPDAEVRAVAADALGRMGNSGTAGLLAAALEDPSPAVRRVAAHSLRRLDLRHASTR